MYIQHINNTSILALGCDEHNTGHICKIAHSAKWLPPLYTYSIGLWGVELFTVNQQHVCCLDKRYCANCTLIDNANESAPTAHVCFLCTHCTSSHV